MAFQQLQFNPPNIKSPFEIEAGYQQIQQGQNQNRLSKMQFQEADRVNTERNALAGIAKQHGNNPEAYGNALMQGGFVKQSQDFNKYQADAARSGVQLKNDQLTGQKLGFDISEKERIQGAQRIGALRGQPYEAVIEDMANGLRDAVAANKISPEDAEQKYAAMLQKIPRDQAGLDAFIDSTVQSVMTPEQQVASRFKERDFRQNAAQDPFNADGTPNTGVQNYGIQKATASATQNYGSPVAGVGPDGKPVFFQPSRGGGAPSVVQGITPPPRMVAEKALPTAAIKSLTGAGQAVEDTARLTNTFKDGYGGKTILGNLSNTIGRLAGDDTGQAQWWQDMDQLQNQTRHELFGSALTKTELAAWEKTSVTPRMEAGEIKKNLQRRQEIEARAASKLARGYSAAGYGEEQINELLGTAAEYLKKPAPLTGKSAKSGVLSRAEILNVELQDAISRGDTQNVNALRREMKAGKIRETAGMTNTAKPASGGVKFLGFE